MKVWFMSPSHAFSIIGNASTPPANIRANLKRRFGEDGCGSAFVRDGDRPIEAHPLHGRPMPGGAYGVTDAEIDGFVAQFEELVNWQARG